MAELKTVTTTMTKQSMPLVTSVEVLARDPSTAWWCSCDVAAQIDAFVDWSTERSVSFAIRHDFVFLLQRIVKRLSYNGDLSQVDASAIQGALETATQRGCVAVVQWLVAEHPQLVARARLMDKAACAGQLELLCWLHCMTKSTPSLVFYTSDAMDGAAGNGFLPVVQWLHAHHGKCTTQAMDDAAAGGFLAVVRWLHANRVEGCSTHAMDAAARNGHLQIVEFLHEHRKEGASSRAIVGAAERGHLSVVRFLWQNRIEQHEQAHTAMSYAAWRGHMAIVKFLLEQRVGVAESLVRENRAVDQ